MQGFVAHGVRITTQTVPKGEMMEVETVIANVNEHLLPGHHRGGDNNGGSKITSFVVIDNICVILGAVGAKETYNREVLYFENFDVTSVCTPVDADVLETFLDDSCYDPVESEFLLNGFRHGFSLGYQGPRRVKIKSPNLRLEVGDEIDLWNKVMKEVHLKRYAGPFREEQLPFRYFIQSPIGLVPKDSGKDSRLIFHLSYPKRPNSSSVNANTPKELCSVSYPDFSEAVNLCLESGISSYLARSDLKSAFRQLGVKKSHWNYLVLKAKSPRDGEWYYFWDKAIPFGGAISCSHFQRFSNCLAHIMRYRTGCRIINYLDDFLFVSARRKLCDAQVSSFIELCESIRIPIALEKTFWGDTVMNFLGFLINTKSGTVSVPLEKLTKARNMICYVFQQKRPIKVKVLQLQKICGFLNFLCRAVIPGRAFTRRLYSKLSPNLKAHHHIRLNLEMQADLAMWLKFINHPSAVARPFLDYTKTITADELDFYVDASKSEILGFGGYSDSDWMQQRWGEGFIRIYDPSIEYLELYALTAAVVAWIHKFANRRIILFTDNESVKFMLNNNSSSCRNCMVLIRIIVLQSLIHNVRIYGKHVFSEENGIADSLSRFQHSRFKKLTKKRGLRMTVKPTPVPEQIWPIEKIWLD